MKMLFPKIQTLRSEMLPPVIYCAFLRKDIRSSARMCARMLKCHILAVNFSSEAELDGAQGYARIFCISFTRASRRMSVSKNTYMCEIYIYKIETQHPCVSLRAIISLPNHKIGARMSILTSLHTSLRAARHPCAPLNMVIRPRKRLPAPLPAMRDNPQQWGT